MIQGGLYKDPETDGFCDRSELSEEIVIKPCDGSNSFVRYMIVTIDSGSLRCYQEINHQGVCG